LIDSTTSLFSWFILFIFFQMQLCKRTFSTYKTIVLIILFLILLQSIKHICILLILLTLFKYSQRKSKKSLIYIYISFSRSLIIPYNIRLLRKIISFNLFNLSCLNLITFIPYKYDIQLSIRGAITLKFFDWLL
jgi:hypothetical protein